MMLDLSKPVRFRNKPDWKVINVLENRYGPDDFKIIINYEIDGIRKVTWTDRDGVSHHKSGTDYYDLVNYDSKYRNIYSNGDVGISYRSRDRADEETSRIRIAVLRIDDDKTAHLEKV